MSEINWTTRQRQSIETAGQSVLVSAAAGSGKTAVLAERCAYLVCDAPERCDVDELLVVTYTHAAASEMRSRIESALRRRFLKNPSPRLSRQLMLIGQASIGTLHSFCNRVLREHFQSAGLDPQYRLLSEEEARLLRLECGRELLERYYDQPNSSFADLIELYARGDDRTLLRQIIRTHDLLGSLTDRSAWLKQAVDRVSDALAGGRIGDSQIGQAARVLMTDQISDLKRRSIELFSAAERSDGADQYADHLQEILSIIVRWQELIDIGELDQLAAELNDLKLPRLPSVKSHEQLKESITAFKEALKKGILRDLCSFTDSEWRAGLRRIAPAMDQFIELVSQYESTYARAKRDQRTLDFSDLERLAYELLADGSASTPAPSNIALSYQKQFKHVLVDEYQDVNQLQDSILRLLSRESSPAAESNWFSVGDVKQSIYRFRLADPERFLRRYDLLKQENSPGVAIDLAENFRSRGEVIEILNGLFTRLLTRESSGIDYAQEHRLVAGAAYPVSTEASGSRVELHLLPADPQTEAEAGDDAAENEDSDLDRTEREAAFIAQQIKRMIADGYRVADKTADGAPALRPMRGGDCAILLRSMRFKSEQIAGVLRGAGLSVHSESSSGFFESMEIRDMLALLRLLHNRQQDIPLAAVLRSPLSGLSDVDELMARIRLAFSDTDAVPFYEAVSQFASHLPASDALPAMLQRLEEWRELANQRPLEQVIETIYNQTGYLAFCSGLHDGAQRVANLIELQQRAAKFGSFQQQGLTRFITFLTDLEEEVDLGQPSTAAAAEDAIRIMSIHRSKGLEFPIVFMPDLGKKHNLEDLKGNILVDRDAYIGLMVPDRELRVIYPSLPYLLARQQIRRQSVMEELRVLYVAMTRAKEKLFLVGTIDAKGFEQLQEQGRNCSGPIPAEMVLSGQRMIDWLLPAAVAMNCGREKVQPSVEMHSPEDVVQWTAAVDPKRAKPEIPSRLLSLQPLDPPPKADPVADSVIRRLERIYPFKQLTETAATQSVSSQKQLDAGHLGDATRPVEFKIDLEMPAFTAEQKKLSAVDLGSATHRVLESLDLKKTTSRSQIAQHVADLLNQQSLTAEQAAAIDLEAIDWFLQSAAGQLIRESTGLLRREVSLYFPDAAGGTADLLDRVMIRGRIDLMCDTAEGLLLIDFKTDRIDAAKVQERTEIYRSQVQTYRLALEMITHQKVARAMLVFLAPRVLVDVT